MLWIPGCTTKHLLAIGCAAQTGRQCSPASTADSSSDSQRRRLMTVRHLCTEFSMVCIYRAPADGFDLGGVLREEIVFSAADECRLAVVSATVDRFLDRCEDTLRHTDHSIRCYLRSHYPDRSYKSPFELPSRKSTRTRYRSLWKRMVCFCAFATSGIPAGGERRFDCSGHTTSIVRLGLCRSLAGGRP